MIRVLIAEDDDSVARFLLQAAREAGYHASVVTTGSEALERALSACFDLLLLDVMLPELDGFAVCRQLREAQSTLPILLLTARDALEDRVRGLDSGADDYIVKPFSLAELLARMRATLRRTTFPATVLQIQDLTLDTTTRRLERGGRTLSLSNTEYTLLEFLMRNAGRTLTRAAILDHVWNYDFNGADGVLDVYVNYLRNKIDRGRTRPLLQTVRGVGYRMGDNARI